jgi:hypothetical protein
MASQDEGNFRWTAASARQSVAKQVAQGKSKIKPTSQKNIPFS